MPGLIPFDYHDTDVILFVVFFLRPGNDSIYNKANSYGHIPISFNASILNSPLSPNFGNAAEEGRMPSVYKNGAIDSCTLDSEDGTTHANQEKLALGTWVSSHFIRRCSYLRLIGWKHVSEVAFIEYFCVLSITAYSALYKTWE